LLHSDRPATVTSGLTVGRIILIGFGKKKKMHGQKLKNPEKESEERLSVLTTGLLMKHHRIILDSVKLIHITKNAEMRQSRIELS